MGRPSSGIEDLDELLSGLFTGDNVVWLLDKGCELKLANIVDSFLIQGGTDGVCCSYVRTAPSVVRTKRSTDTKVKVFDARRGALADPVRLEQAIVEQERECPGRVVFDDLDAMVEQWGRDRTLGFFTRVCPQLFDIGSIAYWVGSRSKLGPRLLDQITKATQCVFELGRGQLRVMKAEGRVGVEGRIVRMSDNGDGRLDLEQEKALGRLGEGLRRVREQRGLSQSDIAALAGVSASAISQAEGGQRGLALDTVLTLAEALDVPLDKLLAAKSEGDYVVRRRDRAGVRKGFVPLIEDPTNGLRAYVVTLGPGESGEPPMAHKGAELVLVAAGLVQVDLGSAAPVLRVGDALNATRVPIAGWRNLLGKPAVLYWVLRD
ncbi:MAG TPA: XRE family transcriptional regulator [Actinomycetota bacterium]|nr:XRE family transcriptional regulator [Actinomycetota bacterium]